MFIVVIAFKVFERGVKREDRKGREAKGSVPFRPESVQEWDKKVKEIELFIVRMI